MDKCPGSLVSRAKKAGVSPAKFAEANIHADSTVGKLARMYYVGQGTHGSGQTTMEQSGDKRSLGQKLYQIG